MDGDARCPAGADARGPRVMTLEDAIARYEATKAAAIATARDAAVRAREEATRAQRVVMNAPAPALAARFARADGFVDRGAFHGAPEAPVFANGARGLFVLLAHHGIRVDVRVWFDRGRTG